MLDIAEKPTKFLLHACCGPCSLEPVRLLRERNIEPHLFYANSNITPPEEYERRLETIGTWAKSESLSFVEDSYDPAGWEESVGRIGDEVFTRFGVIAGDVEGEDGAEQHPPCHSCEADRARRGRCRACYRLRLERAACYAAANGFDALGTTLTVSPYQYTDIIEEELERACKQVGIHAFFEDYRPNYPEATRRSREAGMYRQNYCGCRFSQEEAALERLARKKARDAAKASARAARAAAQAEDEAARIAKIQKRAAYAEKQARKRAVLKQLREADTTR